MTNIFGNISTATINQETLTQVEVNSTGSNMTSETIESSGYSVNPLDDMDAMGITGDEVFEIENKEENGMGIDVNKEYMGEAAINQVLNNSAVEEVKDMNNGIKVVALDAARIWSQLDIEKTSDPDYLRKDVLAGILNSNFGKEYTKTGLKKIKREVLVEELRTKLAEFLNDEDANDGTEEIEAEAVETEVPGAADGFCEPEQSDAMNGVDELVKHYTSQTEVHNIIFGVERGGRTINGLQYYVQKYGKGNYVSEHIMTSVIAEQTTGKPLKNKDGSDNTFTQHQIDVIKGIREYLVKNITRFTTYKDGRVSGYFLNAYTVYKINSNRGMKYWFKYTPESTLKMGKKGETYIVRNNKLYMGKRCVVENMTYQDYLKLDATCSFWEFC